MKRDTREFYTEKHDRLVVTQSDAGDASKIAMKVGASFEWAYMNRRETLRLIANLVRLLLANLRE